MLNQAQRKYVVDRVTLLRTEHTKRITDDIAARTPLTLTPEEKCKAIRDGVATLVIDRVRASGRYSDIPSVTECFDYPAEKATKHTSKKLESEREKRIALVAAAVTRIKDMAILGTSDEAKILAELQAFESKTF